MIAYLLLALVVVSLAFVGELVRGISVKTSRGADPAGSFFGAAAVVLLVLFAGTRDSVGTDFGMYANRFEVTDPTDWEGTLASSPQENGFTILLLLLRSVANDSRWLFLVASALTVILVVIGIKASGTTEFTGALAVYVLGTSYLAPFNILRQGIAIALLFSAVMLFPRRRIIALILAATAPTIHVSSIIAIVLIIACRRMRPKSTFVVASAIAALGGATLLNAVPALGEALSLLNDRYVEYAFASDKVGGFGTFLVAGIHLIVALHVLRDRELTPSQEWWRSIYVLTPALVLLGTSVPWAARLGTATMIFLIPLLPATLRTSSQRPVLIAGYWILGIGYYVAYLLNYGGLLPYQSWLFSGVWK